MQFHGFQMYSLRGLGSHLLWWWKAATHQKIQKMKPLESTVVSKMAKQLVPSNPSLMYAQKWCEGGVLTNGSNDVVLPTSTRHFCD